MDSPVCGVSGPRRKTAPVLNGTATKWMQYLIDHFLKPGCVAKTELPFLQGNHVVSGQIEAQGENRDDHWTLVVEDNKAREA
jgi:hypothetical protein